MRLTLLSAGTLLFALAVPSLQAQTDTLPSNPAPRLTQSARLTSAELPFSSSTQSVPDEPEPEISTTSASTAVDPTATGQNGIPICGITHLVRCIEDLGQDDKGIFTSPLRVQPKDAYWLAPLGAATGLAFAYDTDAEQTIGINTSRANTANKISDLGSFYATGAEGAGVYFVGLARHNPKLAETGRLATEAVIDSGTVTLATKLVSNRERPLQGGGQGNFWANGTRTWQWDSSFPSDHATASMALARVVAGEYPHWYIVLPAYGFAESISISRLLANQHFPSDVIVGQAIGFLTGSYILNHRALYRSGSRKPSMVSRMVGSVSPIANPQTHTVGASMQIPLGR